MSAFSLGARLALSRSFRLSLGFAYLVACLFALTVALLERAHSSARATDHALGGAVFGIALPLLSYLVVSGLTSGARIDVALDPLARHGAARKELLLGATVGSVAALAPAALVLTLVTLIAGHGTSDPSLARDIAPSLWVTLLAVTAYIAWFLLGSTFGRKGRGKVLFLAVDWVLGAGSGVLAAPWPRGHLRNLLGLEPVLAMPQWAGLCAILVVALTCFGLTQLVFQRDPSLARPVGTR